MMLCSADWHLIGDFAAMAVALGGVVAAEHGLGKRKRDLLSLQRSAGENGSNAGTEAALSIRTGCWDAAIFFRRRRSDRSSRSRNEGHA